VAIPVPLEGTEDARVGYAIAQRVVAALELADLVALAEAFDFDCDVRHKTEVRGQKSKGRGQISEVGDHKSEVRSQLT
jgi:hypothetical protein